mgnify:FL=1
MVSIGRTPASKEKSRAFLQAVFDNGGSADTTAIREASGLKSEDMQYRYDTLEAAGLIDVQYDSNRSAQGEAPVKVAVLTEKADEEIDKGLLQGGQYQPGGDVPEDVGELAEELVRVREALEDNEEAIEQVQEYVSQNVYRQLAMLRWSVARMEAAMEKSQWVDLESVEGVERKDAELRERAGDFDVQA